MAIFFIIKQEQSIKDAMVKADLCNQKLITMVVAPFYLSISKQDEINRPIYKLLSISTQI
jgi:hypothetical protein